MQDYTQEDLEKLLEKEKPPFTIYLKAFFLLFVVGGGMLFVNYMAKNAPQRAPEDRTSSKTMESILGVKDKVVGNDTVSRLKTDVEEGGVLGALDTLSGEVKNEATQAADQALEKTTDSTVDYIYENTVVRVIEKMIEGLPEDQKKQFVERMCK